MKKLIALLLVLALCLGVLVACNDSEKMRAEIESELRENVDFREIIKSELLAEMEAEEKAKREKSYIFYSVEAPCNRDEFGVKYIFDSWISFYNSMENFNMEVPNITSDTFQDHYVLMVCVGNLLYRGKEARYNNLRLDLEDSSNIYSIDYYANYYHTRLFLENDQDLKTGFHFVLIPKEDAPSQMTPDFFVHKVLNIAE